jgi:lipoate-protein ligase A
MPSPLPAHVQMALEEVLLERLIAGRRGPTLRFWEWTEPALVLGSHQVLANEVDGKAAGELGFTVARRMSGGGTMIVEPGRAITYSLYAPASVVAGLSFVQSFAFLDGWVVECLRGLRVPAGYRPINDLVSPEGKIGGAAQARRRGFVLHHTAIAFAMEPSLVTRLIRLGRPPVSPRGLRSAEREVSPLDRWLGLDRDQVVRELADCFGRGHPTTTGVVSPGELADARDLAERKYATAEWLDRLR